MFENINDNNRVLILANKMADQVDGKQAIVSGAIRVWIRDAVEGPEPITLVTPDLKDFQLGHSRVVVTSPGIDAMDPKLARYYNGSGGWQILHSPSYSEHYPQNVLDEMLEAANISGDHKSQFEKLNSLIEFAAKSSSIEESFFDRYAAPICEIGEGKLVHIEGYKTYGLLRRFGKQLHEQGCKIIVRVHESVSPEIDQPKWGKDFIRALSWADELRMHTNRDIDTVANAFDALEVPRLPNMDIYKLGIDFEHIKNAIKEITPDNYQTVIPGFDLLNAAQQRLLEANLKTRETIPYRFLCIDALDPIKGAYQLYQATENILNEAANKGDLSKYRFFFIQSGRFPSDSEDKFNMNTAYALSVMNLRDQLANKYPESVFICDAIRGDASKFVPALAANCHPLSGGSFEGLNLAWQEMLYANYLTKNSCCLGVLPQGAGFASQVVYNGNSELGYFPEAANVEQITNSIRELVSLQESAPDLLRQKLVALTEKEVLNRTDSIFNIK